jgi:hypothetical protein
MTIAGSVRDDTQAHRLGDMQLEIERGMKEKTDAFRKQDAEIDEAV